MQKSGINTSAVKPTKQEKLIAGTGSESEEWSSDWTWETCSESEEDETGSTGMYLSQLLHVRFCRPAKIYFVYIIINFMQKKFLFTFLQQQLPQQIQLLPKEHLQ